MTIRLAANISLLFSEQPYLERPAAAAAAGFTAVETWWPFGADPAPSTADIDAFLAAVGASGLQLVALNFFAGDMPAGDRGLVSNPGRADEFRSSTATVVQIAEQTGCQLFNALYGVRDASFDPRAQDRVATDNLRFAADALAPINGTVLVEALADGENGAYPLRTPSDVIAVLDFVDRSNVKLLADFYHYARNGFDYPAVLADGIDRIGHVQIADAPGRHEPGTGEIDFAGLFGALTAAGYDGWTGAEYRPDGATIDGLHWIADLGLELGGRDNG